MLTTHYMDEAEQLCDRLVVMDKAEIVAEGSPRELIERTPRARCSSCASRDDVRAALDGRLDGLARAVEVLPDRVLLYADDGERRWRRSTPATSARDRRWCGARRSKTSSCGSPAARLIE